MSIYADKKNGKPTGRWRVEVQRQGRVLKARCDTHAEAVAKEDELKRILKLPEIANAVAQSVLGVTATTKVDRRERAKPTTLLEALDASQESLWLKEAHRETQSSSAREIANLIGPAKPLRRVGTEDFDAVIAVLRSRGLKDNTLNRKLSAVRCVLRWCFKRRYIVEMPEIPFYEEGEGRIRWLTYQEEAEAIRLLCSYGRADIADYVAVAIDTGMRRGEMLSLEPGQVEGGWVHLWKTKTGVPRSIPLYPRSEAILEARKATGLFRGLQKHTLRWYWDRVRANMGLTGDEDFVVHALRQTCATRLVNDYKVDVFTVQKWMGHKVLETTRRYCHINDASLLRARDAMVQHSHQNYNLGASTGEGANGGGNAGPTGPHGNVSGTGGNPMLPLSKVA
jgi:integrase